MVHIITTSDGYWGTGNSILKAVENAKVRLSTKVILYTLLKEGAEFEIRGMGSVYCQKGDFIYEETMMTDELKQSIRFETEEV